MTPLDSHSTIQFEKFIKSSSLVDRYNLYIKQPTSSSYRERKLLLEFFSGFVIKKALPNTTFTFDQQQEGKKINDKEFKHMMKPIIKNHASVSPGLKIYLNNNEISDTSIDFLVKDMINPHKTPEDFFLGLANNKITVKGGEIIHQALIKDLNLRCELPNFDVKSNELETHADKLAEQIIRQSQRNSNFYNLEKSVDGITKQLDELYDQSASEEGYEEKCMREMTNLVKLKSEDYIAMWTNQMEQKNSLLSQKKGKDKLSAERQAINIQENHIGKINSKIAKAESKLHRNLNILPKNTRDIHLGTLNRHLSEFNENLKILRGEVNEETSTFASNNPPIQPIGSNISKIGTLGRELIGELDERLQKINKETLAKANKNNGPTKILHHETNSNVRTNPKDSAGCASFLHENYRSNPLIASVGIGCISNNEARPLALVKKTADGYNQSLFRQEQRANPLGLFGTTANMPTNNAVEEEEQLSNKSRLKNKQHLTT
ncbi:MULTISPECIES: hypothetical protein [Candidatus Rhabdochlamydia]|nr:MULTISPECIES: hypothetical protein [Rhabdochlamydia]KAG6558692.1 hypothetical protein RHOW815_001315 [Candidatus Rhabdochlamydia sp. W815]MCL6756363.1 hypothetical protein [Candidatus Rhabdochlamydia oedothoracis]